jgi:hypothetical protein
MTDLPDALEALMITLDEEDTRRETIRLASDSLRIRLATEKEQLTRFDELRGELDEAQQRVKSLTSLCIRLTERLVAKERDEG